MSRPHDSAYNERKLKPIYDYLDNGYFKKSMQEIDKLLKKNKDWPYLRVLKALTLIRMNRQKEGIDILNEVHNDVPYDESTLQTMTICYRDLHQLEMIPSIYENALKKDPTSEKLYTHLFMAYVRLQDYKKQQLTALNLFKVHQKNPYYFWAVMSIYMQAITASDKTMATKITLPLAEKMCQKFYNDNKFESEQEVELYLMILEKQRKFTTMIDLINNSKVAGKLADTLGFVQHRKVLLLKSEGRLNEAFNDLVELIRRNCDQTEYYSELFHLATSLDEANAEKTETAFEYTLQFVALLDEMCNQSRASNWVSKLEESKDAEKCSVEKGKSRGPAIAKIIHFHRIHQQAKEGASSTKLDYGKLSNSIDGIQKDDYIVDLIYEFFLQFGSKFVCVKDLIYILQQTQLSQERIQSLLLKMKLSLLNLNKESSLEEVNKSLGYHYLDHYTSDLSSGLTNNYAQLSVLFPLYYTALRLVDGAKKQEEDGQKEVEDKSKEAKSGTPSNSSQPFEPVIYLLANKICAGVDIYQDSRLLPSSATIPELLILLESALIRNVHDFYSKLLLIRLYNSLGATSASHALYESLDVKLIQNDTLGHFFLTPFLSTGVFSHAQQFLIASWKFYSYNFKEASDFIINLYKYGSFTKIEEIMAFNDKLRNSIQHRFSFIERHFVNLLIDCKNHLSFSTLANDSVSQILNGSFEVDWDKICDNRDLSLLRANQSQLHSHILETLKQTTRNDDILWLRYRFVLMHSLINASHLSESLFAEVSTDNGDTQKAANEKLSLESLTHLMDQLTELLKALKHAASKESLKYCLEGPSPSRLHSYFKNRQSLAISMLLNYLLGIFKYCSRSDASISTMSLNLPDILAELNTSLEAIQNSQLSIFTVRQTLEELTNWTETLSICISILGVALNTVQKFVKASKKFKKKKSSDGCQYKDSEQVIGTINEQLSCVRSSLEKALKQLQTTFEKGPLVNLEMPTFELHFLSQLENASSIGDTVKEKLKLSYEKSFSELLAIALNKLKYLSLLLSTANQPQQQH